MKNKTTKVAVSQKQHALLRRHAKSRGMTMGAYVDRAIRSAINEDILRDTSKSVTSGVSRILENSGHPI